MKKYKNNVILILLFVVTASLLSAKIPGKQIFIETRASGTKLIGGEVDDSSIREMGEFKFGYYFSRKFALWLNGGYGFVTVRDDEKNNSLSSHIEEKPDAPYRTTFMPISMGLRYNFLSNKIGVPYMGLGIGMFKWDLENTDESTVIDSDTNLFVCGIFGAEWEISRHVGINFGFKYQHLFDQTGDMSGLSASELNRGDVQSGNLSFGIGLTIRFGGYKDSDHDGFRNSKDKCPFSPEDFDGFEDEDGCPDYDNDKDALADSVETNTGIFIDATNTGTDPNASDTDLDGIDDYDEIMKYKTNPVSVDSDNDKLTDGDEINNYYTNPVLADSDNDNINDYDEINIHQTDPNNADTDGDGIVDGKDMCPTEAETFNGFNDTDGCPDKKPEVIFKKKAPIILEGINFKMGSSELTDEAKTVVMKVVRTLLDYPEMQLEISGHSDNTGSRSYNLKLSKARAQSVKQFLVDEGIEENRLQAIGLGPDHPIANNNTEEGRKKNRRIEFFRIK